MKEKKWLLYNRLSDEYRIVNIVPTGFRTDEYSVTSIKGSSKPYQSIYMLAQMEGRIPGTYLEIKEPTEDLIKDLELRLNKELKKHTGIITSFARMISEILDLIER